jgi:hypothetical protein
MERVNEEWRDIQGFENYQVSNMGNVRSKERVVTQKGHKNNYKRIMKSCLLKPRKQNSGYLIVWLSVNGKSKPYTIHRLVAKAFLAMSDGEVNHKDGDKTNNFVGNLEWVSRSEHIIHSYEKLGRKKSMNKRVLCVETGEVFDSMADAERVKGIPRRSICHVLHGRNKTAGGYTWKQK